MAFRKFKSILTMMFVALGVFLLFSFDNTLAHPDCGAYEIEFAWFVNPGSEYMCISESFERNWWTQTIEDHTGPHPNPYPSWEACPYYGIDDALCIRKYGHEASFTYAFDRVISYGSQYAFLLEDGDGWSYTVTVSAEFPVEPGWQIRVDLDVWWKTVEYIVSVYAYAYKDTDRAVRVYVLDWNDHIVADHAYYHSYRPVYLPL